MGRGSTAAAVALDTVADERKKMADGVARSPSRLCSRDGKICCYRDALSTIFLLAFVSCFLLFVFRFSFFFSSFSFMFPTPRYVYLLCVPSFVQQPSATLSKKGWRGIKRDLVWSERGSHESDYCFYRLYISLSRAYRLQLTGASSAKITCKF